MSSLVVVPKRNCLDIRICVDMKRVELELESRNITTFATHVGLFLFKRLVFGISYAPEMYQHCIRMALDGCDVMVNKRYRMI